MQPDITTQYTIGKRTSSIYRTYIIPSIGREVSSIIFYNNKGIITQTSSGWLNSNKEFRDTSMYDIKNIILTKELKHHNNNYNIEKAMLNKCHFTINNKKVYSFDEPSCTLYLYVSQEGEEGADFILLGKEEFQRLFTFASSYTCTIQKFSHTSIKPIHGIIQNNIHSQQNIYIASYEKTGRAY